MHSKEVAGKRVLSTNIPLIIKGKGIKGEEIESARRDFTTHHHNGKSVKRKNLASNYDSFFYIESGEIMIVFYLSR